MQLRNYCKKMNNNQAIQNKAYELVDQGEYSQDRKERLKSIIDVLMLKESTSRGSN